MRVGDRIMRKSTLEGGYIIAARKQSSGVFMVRVNWDLSTAEWLPSEEVRPWDKLQTPPVPQTTSWGRTTPEYLVALRRNLRINGQAGQTWRKRDAQSRLADELVKTNTRKQKGRNRVRKLIDQFNRGGFNV